MSNLGKFDGLDFTNMYYINFTDPINSLTITNLSKPIGSAGTNEAPFLDILF